MKSWLRLPANLLESIEMKAQEAYRPKGYGNVDVSSVNSGDSVGLLHGEVKAVDGQRPRWLEKLVGAFRSKSRRSWAVSVVTVLFLVLLLSTASTKPRVIKDVYNHITKPKQSEYVPTEERMLYIISADRHVELSSCRSIMSSAVLQYPTMHLLEGDPKFDIADTTRERNLERLDKTSRFLNDLPPKRDGDVVLVLDEPNSWFQLRPEVLMQRFLDINDRANQRLERAYGSADIAARLGIRQDIIFTAQTACASDLIDTPICNAAPQPSDPRTARYLGAGLHIGTVSSMRALYTHAAELGRASPSWPSIHSLMTTIFGTQEQQRALLLANPRSPAPAAPDFSIGLDTSALLSLPISTPADDLLFRTHDDPSRGAPLSDRDILASKPPYWTLAGVGGAGLPDATPWANVSLLTHARSHVVPAVVHAAPDVAERWWREFWMARSARALMDLMIYQDQAAAIVRGPRTGSGVRFWAEVWEKPGVQVVGGEFRGWVQGKCNEEGVVDGVFMDGKGKWVSTYF